jgi:D-glycero-alpha-D-manno-heptose-7-phosphate kinase
MKTPATPAPAAARTGGTHGMVIGTAPLRISLAGGGTDLPRYAGRKGGVVVGAAIDLGVSVVRRARLVGGGVRACLDACSVTEDARTLTNAFARVALHRHGPGEPVELVSFGDAPGGSGLGSSAAFCVALLGVLEGSDRDPLTIADRAGEIETAGLGRPVGKQDHYLSALGGFQRLRFDPDGRVRAERIEVAPHRLRRLDEELLLFFTGLTRDAGTVLAVQDERLRRADAAVTRRLDEIKELTVAMYDVLTHGDVSGVGELLGRHWVLKKGLSEAVSPASVEAAYADARAAGATGGKLVGAGGGGHLLLHVPRAHQPDVRAVLRRHGYAERPFTLGGPGLRISVV